MNNAFAIAGLAAGLFASTNIDNAFVLLGLFSDNRFHTIQIIFGQYIGIYALFIFGAISSLASLVIAPAYLGLLGLAPVTIGLNKLWNLRNDAESDTAVTYFRSHGAILSVAAMTIANGGDNVSIYTSLFSTRSVADLTVIGLVFFAMTALWLFSCHWLTRHPTLGAPIRYYGHRLVPFVLVGLGVFIMIEAGTFHLLA